MICSKDGWVLEDLNTKLEDCKPGKITSLSSQELTFCLKIFYIFLFLNTQAVLTKANAKLVNIATKVTTFAVRSSAPALWGTLGHNLRTRRFQKCLGQRPSSPVTPAWSLRHPRPILTIKVMTVISQSPLMAMIAEKRRVLCYFSALVNSVPVFRRKHGM